MAKRKNKHPGQRHCSSCEEWKPEAEFMPIRKPG
jgi:hypothetical protein